MSKRRIPSVRRNVWELDVTGITNVGKVRQVNEDNLYFNGTIFPQDHGNTIINSKPLLDSSRPLFAIFDGMGGYAAGERASFLAANTAKQLFNNEQERSNSKLLEICTIANSLVCDEMTKSKKRIGTTASMLYFNDGKYTVCNIGDSPVLLYRDGSIAEISLEHTERSTFEEATGKKADSKKKFKLTQNIGIFPQEMSIEPYLSSDELRNGDTFIICSDGLTDMVEPNDIRRVIEEQTTASDIVQTLCNMALEAGGKDNITIICIKAAKQSDTKSLFRMPKIAIVTTITIIALLAVVLVPRIVSLSDSELPDGDSLPIAATVSLGSVAATENPTDVTEPSIKPTEETTDNSNAETNIALTPTPMAVEQTENSNELGNSETKNNDDSEAESYSESGIEPTYSPERSGED